jgi:hypothetical protein
VHQVHDFPSGSISTHRPHLSGGGHGGGDHGIIRQFILAVDAVKNHGASVSDAQHKYIGCTIEEVIRSHAMVFAAEAARVNRTVVHWGAWWQTHVESRLGLDAC